ncbi:alanine--glyoxylate aminotransferase family protein [Helicobacter muridarum]|uniref:Aminotransferase n=1 Tax=Helicobacter muridarum TaxID=216 RepID=A0A377PXE9_9HELI|nr:alanine--glyoxylate aminotransferase family protein [Helicobacter muridarum]TLD99860.1 alanine--glyoxylate aminotransferase family protein [Helicobacter muridarum]STQ86931.1 aminotransferase [Helicobacter muridarum]
MKLQSNLINRFATPLLFTPGPTPCPEFIRIAMSQPTLHHRTKEFESIFASVRESLIRLLGMSDVLMLASSGTGAMEACIDVLSSKKILTINSGKFGERFGSIGRALQREVIEISNEWDTPVSLNEVINAMKQHNNIECVCLQICESSGGVAHPYNDIFHFIKENYPNVFTIADGITAVGVEEIDVSHIDALIGGSQKAFMLPPGLAVIGLSDFAINFIQSNPNGYYFNLSKELKYQQKNTTAYTAATSIIMGLKAYFDMLDSKELSIKDIYSYTEILANAVSKSMCSIGLKIYPKTPAKSMTVVQSEYAKEIIATLKSQYNINVANGQDHLKDKIFRINQMGYVPLHEVAFVVNAIELSLSTLGLRDFDSTANRVFFESIAI